MIYQLIFKNAATAALSRRTLTASLSRAYTQGTGYGRGSPSPGEQREQCPSGEAIKADIGERKTFEQAQRQAHLGATNEEARSAGEAEAGSRGPGASETVEQGGPLSQGDGEMGGPESTQQTRADEGAQRGKESRETGGYSMAGRAPGAASIAPSSSTTTMTMLLDGLQRAVLPAPPALGTSMAWFSNTSGSGDSPTRNDQNPTRKTPRSQPQSGVDPSYVRASGMPTDASEEASAATARKQPQKDKSTMESVKETFTAAGGPSMGDQDGNVLLGGSGKGDGIVESVKEGVKKVISGGRKVAAKAGTEK